MNMNKYLSIKEVAALTGKSVHTVRGWARKGLVPARKFPKNIKGHWYIKLLDIPTFLRK